MLKFRAIKRFLKMLNVALSIVELSKYVQCAVLTRPYDKFWQSVELFIAIGLSSALFFWTYGRSFYNFAAGFGLHGHRVYRY
jgi:hypothetical protein